MAGQVDEPMVREVLLWIESDADLYRQQFTPIIKNLTTKYARGVYDRAKARKMWGYLVANGITRAYGAPHVWAKAPGGKTAAQIANKATRDKLASVIEEYEYEQIKKGEYNHLLPKKYQKNPGARWHVQQAHTARTLEDASKRKARKHFYRGQGRAHLMSAVMAKRMGMNPPRRRRKRRRSTRR